MGLKTRRMAMLLAVMVAAQSVQLPTVVYGHQVASRATSEVSKGSLSTLIMFDYPLTYEKVQEQELRVTLWQDNEKLLILDLGQANPIQYNPKDYTVTVIPKNSEGELAQASDTLANYTINIRGVEQGTYTLEYEGTGYSHYETQPIRIDDYSKSVTVHTGQDTFSYGDLDGDREVTEDDLALLESAIEVGDHDKDLSGDCKVDIEDLVYLTHQIVSEGEEVQQATSAILPGVWIGNIEQAVDDAGLVIEEGSIGSLFDTETKESVKFTKSPGASGDTMIIPIDLGEATIDTQIVEIVSPDVSGGLAGGTVVVEYEENGRTRQVKQVFGEDETSSRRIRTARDEVARKKVVIDLGKRVPVKKVTIQVDKVVDVNGNPEYVVLEEVNFIKDILPDGPQATQSIVKGIRSTVGSETAHLEWQPVPNVQGYRVYYGEESGKYEHEINVDQPSVTLEGLENFKTYYVAISAISDDWTGPKSLEYEVTPEPTSAPKAPDFLQVEPMDQALRLSWKEAENATYYNVYYKKSTDQHYEQFIPSGTGDGTIEGAWVAIGGLENNVSYDLYVVAGNSIGVSAPSLSVTGIPEKVEVKGPVLPTNNKISVEAIENVSMVAPYNVGMEHYPNGFETVYNIDSLQDGVKNIVDNNYATHWTANVWYQPRAFTVTFDHAREMDYMAYVARIDGQYRESLSKYSITIWEEGDDLTAPGKKVVPLGYIKRMEDMDGESYVILEFPKHDVKQIQFEVAQWDGSPTNVSISEVAFYEYDGLDTAIRGLFADQTFTTLKEGVTQEQIDALRSQLQSEDTYYVSKEVFADELRLAESLLKGETEVVGLLKDTFVTIDASKDVKKANDWSPLGIVAGPNTELTIYADIPEGETLEIIPTQYFAEVSKLAGKPIVLSSGRNIINLPQIHDISGTKGGALYYRYSGTQADAIKLHIRDITQQSADVMKEIPVLELYHWYAISEATRREAIGTYIDTLEVYVATNSGNHQTNPFNATEISMRNVLLSVPADQVLAGIQLGGASREAQIDALYESILAWEELMHIMYTTYGLEDTEDVLKSRQNIRYMRMFGGAFMYAAGNHIGVGYGSVAPLVQGKPTASTHTPGEMHANSLFGWGIAHEIGHNLDRLGQAEVTNNIYSLMGQTYDGKDNILPSRLETANKYQDIYQKVAVGDKGIANDVFTQLGMYWQLHLAYDEGANHEANGPMSFYNELFKRYEEGHMQELSGMDKFAAIATEVAGKDLSEFFTRWGVVLSDQVLEMMRAYPKEERKIQYITDETRRQRLAGNPGAVDIDFTATTQVVEDKIVRLNIQPDEMIPKEAILGYEIFRDGKQIAFTTEATYEDTIGSANNMVFTYEVRAIDILGDVVSEKVHAGDIRIEYDTVIDEDMYTIRFESGVHVTTDAALQVDAPSEPAIIIELKDNTPVSGLKITTSPSLFFDSDFTVEIGVKEGDDYVYTTAKQGNFAVNDTNDSTKFINYFNKPGAVSSDTRLWMYDADRIRITGEAITESFFESFKIQPITYPGDNVALETYKLAIMGEDYGEDEDGTPLLEKGTMVVVGSYRGDPLYNTIQIKGKFMEHATEEGVDYVERAMSGATYMFAEVPEDGETSDISDGFFIFVPDIQGEEELQGHTDCSAVSILPTEIMAEMYRYDTTDNTGSRRKTSETLWYATPSYDSLPEIILENTRAFVGQEDEDETY